MQIQDSSTSTVNDERRRTVSEPTKRTPGPASQSSTSSNAIAAASASLDAFAELFQLIASATPARENSAASAPAVDQKPASVSDSSASQVSAQTTEDEPADELERNRDESTSDSVVASAVAATLPVTNKLEPQPKDIAAGTAEGEQSEAITQVKDCHAGDPQSVTSAGQLDQSALQSQQVNETGSALAADQTTGTEFSGRENTKRSTGDEVAQQLTQSSDLGPTGTGQATDASADNKNGDTAGQELKAGTAGEQPVEEQAIAGDVSDRGGNGRDESRDRNREPLRSDRSDRSPRETVTSAPLGNSSSGSITLDQGFAATPTAAPETALLAPTLTALNAAASVAGSAGLASSSGATVIAASSAVAGVGSKSDAAGPTTPLSTTGTLDMADDAGTASTMEKASKSRQSEIADRARLIHRISKAFQKLGIDGGQVRLKMHPEDLGTVQLEMKINGRSVTASVTADSEEAARLLQDQLPELRQRLESQGLTVDRLQVEQRTDNGSSSFNGQSGFERQFSEYQEAARRQNQRLNTLPGALGRSITITAATVTTRQAANSPTTLTTSLDINI